MIALIGLCLFGLGVLIAAGWIIKEIFWEYGALAGIMVLMIVGGAITALVGHFIFGQM